MLEPDLNIPDLCARLDRIKVLCGRLEELQHDQMKYRDLVDRIRSETDIFRHTLEKDARSHAQKG
jgi:hypothetical protein